MWLISDSEISVPIEISAASLTAASNSSVRIFASEMSTACVRSPIAQVSKDFAERGDTLTHCSDHFGVREVVHNDLGHLREVPSIPLLDSHSVDIDFLVQVVE